MSTALVIAADLLVAVLLVATIASSVRLSRRISGMKSDEAAMRSTIAELVSATETAERAVGGLRSSLSECDRNLVEKLGTAERYNKDLDRAVAAGESVLGRIEGIVEAMRRGVASPSGRAEPAAGPGSDALKTVIASAQAVAERSARWGRNAA